jgi:hypothetical protein
VLPFAVQFIGQPAYNYWNIDMIDKDTMIGSDEGMDVAFELYEIDGQHHEEIPVLHLFRPNGDFICDITKACEGYTFHGLNEIA